MRVHIEGNRGEVASIRLDEQVTVHHAERPRSAHAGFRDLSVVERHRQQTHEVSRPGRHEDGLPVRQEDRESSPQLLGGVGHRPHDPSACRQDKEPDIAAEKDLVVRRPRQPRCIQVAACRRQGSQQPAFPEHLAATAGCGHTTDLVFAGVGEPLAIG